MTTAAKSRRPETRRSSPMSSGSSQFFSVGDRIKPSKLSCPACSTSFSAVLKLQTSMFPAPSSRRSRSGRVRHYIGASARDGRQPAAARKAQHQCGGSGQRSKALPQAFLRRVYFFFFPVFHVVFSFC